ncbi:hypothetical protein D3C73_1207800 [compost metagenome]
MGVDGEAGVPQDSVHLVPDDRDAAYGSGVRTGGKQTYEAAFTVDVAQGIEALDSDVIEVCGPVHGGARVCLGNHQGTLLPCALAACVCEVLDLTRGVACAQQAKAAVLTELKNILAILIYEVVFAVPQESEVSVVQPTQKVLCLPEFGDLLRMRNATQCFGQLKSFTPHLGPVLDRGPDVTKDALQPCNQFLPRIITYPVNFNRDP